MQAESERCYDQATSGSDGAELLCHTKDVKRSVWLIIRTVPDIAGHADYKTTANFYTHVRDEMLKKATVNMGEVFGSREKG